jgi:hypothetical protein
MPGRQHRRFPRERASPESKSVAAIPEKSPGVHEWLLPHCTGSSGDRVGTRHGSALSNRFTGAAFANAMRLKQSPMINSDHPVHGIGLGRMFMAVMFFQNALWGAVSLGCGLLGAAVSLVIGVFWEPSPATWRAPGQRHDACRRRALRHPPSSW